MRMILARFLTCLEGGYICHQNTHFYPYREFYIKAYTMRQPNLPWQA